MRNRHRHVRRIASIGIALFGMTGLPGNAAVLNVPGDFRTIQAAINAARVGDEVVVAIGTYRVNL